MASDRWTLRSLYSIASYINGRATKSSEVVGDGVPVIKIAELNRGITSQTARVDASVIEDRHWVVDGDLLFAWSGTVGVHIYRGERAALNQHIFRVVAGDGVDQRFLRYLLQAQLPTFKRYVAAKRTTMGHVTVRDLRETNVLVPPTSEQHAIASVLGALDDKIESNRRLAAHSKTLLATWFQRIARSAAERQRVVDIAYEVRRRIHPAKQPTEIFEQFSIPAFDAGRGPEICTGADMASAKTLLPDEPAILVSKLNPRTKRVWWPERLGIGRAVCSPEFVALVPRDPSDAAWLFGCAAFDSTFYGQVLAAVSGTTGSRQRVKPADVLSATIPVVAPQERAGWESIARDIRRQSVTLLRESRTLSAIRDALLPKLVSGQIRVPLSDDPDEMVGAAVEGLEREARELEGRALRDAK